jgi:hypothetical protein
MKLEFTSEAFLWCFRKRLLILYCGLPHSAIYRLSNVATCIYEDCYTQCTKSSVQIFKETNTVNLEENEFGHRKSPASFSGCGKACFVQME